MSLDRVLGCRVTDEIWEAWSARLVYPLEPIYLTDAHKVLLPDGTLLLTRRELGENFVAAPLDFMDSYWLYSVSRTADTAALLSPAQFHGLPQAAREELLRLPVSGADRG